MAKNTTAMTLDATPTAADIRIVELELPEKTSSGSKIKLRVPLDAKLYYKPQPQGKHHRIVDASTIRRHPNQPRFDTGSERVDNALVQSYLPAMQDGEWTIGGQDPRFAPPLAAEHGGRLTWLKGHRRALFFSWLRDANREVFDLVFPGGMLVEIRQIDPMDPAARAQLFDHTLQEKRKDLLLYETVLAVDGLAATMKGAPEKVRNARLIEAFGKATVQQVQRLRALPPEVEATLKERAEKYGLDAFTWSQLKRLYDLALEYKNAGTGNTGRQMLPPNPNDPGPEFEAYFLPIREGKNPDKERKSALTGNAIRKILDRIQKAGEIDLTPALRILDPLLAGDESAFVDAVKLACRKPEIIEESVTAGSGRRRRK